MKTLYFECHMGAAGDMLMGALLELHPHPDIFLEKMNHIGLPGVEISRSSAEKCGIYGTKIHVLVQGKEEQSEDISSHHHDHHHHDHGHDGHDHDHHHDHEDHHHHWDYPSIVTLIQGLELPSEVKEDAIQVYRLIAEAESLAHRVPMDQVHFHEVGSLDAVADIVGCCLLLHELHPQRIVASPVHVGSGMVRCAHGILPVPAPATAHILQGIPTYGGSIEGELCTPTGAALLAHFATSFGNMPLMVTERIGYGMGSKDYPMANCVRAFLGKEEQSLGGDFICEISCNVDDMTGESLGYAMEKLFQSGAVDVFYTPIMMKKNRPGIKVTCLCPAEREEEVSLALLRHTTTLGVRSVEKTRTILNSNFQTKHTSLGDFQLKISQGHGITKKKVEFQDMERLARENNLSIDEVKEEIYKLDF